MRTAQSFPEIIAAPPVWNISFMEALCSGAVGAFWNTRAIGLSYPGLSPD